MTHWAKNNTNQSTRDTKTEVDRLVGATQPYITTTTALTLTRIRTNQVFTKFVVPPPRNMDLQLQANGFTFGTPVFMTTATTTIKMWRSLYFEQGLKVSNVLSICINSPTNPDVWMDTTSK